MRAYKFRARSRAIRHQFLNTRRPAGIDLPSALFESRFSQDTLAEYPVHRFNDGDPPLFRTVGIDHSFYHPADANQPAHYATQVPDDFRFCQKVWEGA